MGKFRDELQSMADHRPAGSSVRTLCIQAITQLDRKDDEIARLRGLVKAAEWSGDAADGLGQDPIPACLHCYAPRPGPHAPDCPAFHPNRDVR